MEKGDPPPPPKKKKIQEQWLFHYFENHLFTGIVIIFTTDPYFRVSDIHQLVELYWSNCVTYEMQIFQLDDRSRVY